MKNFLFLVTVISIIVSAGCSKDNDDIIPLIAKDELTSLCRNWELHTYAIKTDGMYHYFSGNDVSTHVFRSLTFQGDGTYTAGNNELSGSFELSSDHTQLVLKPEDSALVPMIFKIDHFSPQQIQFSTPTVNIQPANPLATNYENLIRFQGLSWLYNRNIDTSGIRSLQIQFTYY